MKAGYRPVRACAFAARVLLLSALTLVATTNAPRPSAADTAVWTSMGPSGGAVLTLVADPQHPEVLYAGTLVAGVFKSVDGGLNWQHVTIDLPYGQGGAFYPQIFSIAVDPTNSDRVFISTPDGLFRSTDGGVHVTALPQPAVTSGTFNLLLTIPSRPGELFGTNSAFNGYVYRSTDNGETWLLHTQGMFGTVQALAVDGTGLCAATSLGFYRRAPGGNWKLAGYAPAGTILDLAALSGTMYLSTSQGCYTSADGGAQWDPLTLPDAGPIFKMGPDLSGHVLLYGRGHLVRVGAGWVASEVPNTDYPFTSATGIVRVGGTLVAGTAMGIYRSDDDGVTWRPSHQGMINTDILPLAADPADPDYFYVASGLLCDSGIYLTTDGGRTWSQRGQRMPNTDVRALAVHPTDRNTLLAGTGNKLDVDGQNGGIWKSTDAGMTWRNVTVGDFPDQARLVIDIQYSPGDPNIVYACVVGVLQGFYKSLDGGETWARKTEGMESMPPSTEGGDDTFVDYFAALCMAIDPRDPQHIYMGQGGCWGAINVTHDGGEHWTRRAKDRGTPGLPAGPGLEMFKLVVDSDNPDIVYAAGHSDPPVGVYKTTDGGATWVGLEPRVTGKFLSNGLAMDPRDHQRLYAATRLGVWTTDNGGAHWTNMNEGLPHVAESGRSLSIHPLRPDRLLYGTATAGLFSRLVGDGTPVTLVRFAATPGAQGGITLDWETTDEVDHAGFHVYRAPHGGASADRVRLTDRLITTGGPNYRYLDAAVAPGAYDYYLAEVSRAGATSWHGPLVVAVTSAPAATGAALSAAPNPFAQRTVLSFVLPAPGPARLQVFDISGRHVATLLDDVLDAGAHDVIWDGRAADGTPAVAGVYYARFFAADGSHWTRKVSLAR